MQAAPTLPDPRYNVNIGSWEGLLRGAFNGTAKDAQGPHQTFVPRSLLASSIDGFLAQVQLKVALVSWPSAFHCSMVLRPFIHLKGWSSPVGMR